MEARGWMWDWVTPPTLLGKARDFLETGLSIIWAKKKGCHNKNENKVGANKHVAQKLKCC